MDSDNLDNTSRDTLLEKLENYDEHLQDLNENKRRLVKNLLSYHKDVFSDEPRYTHVYEHDIRVTVQKPFVRKSYPVPLRQQSAVDKEIDRMPQQGIITRSCSEFRNPIRIVQKKMETCAFVLTRDG